MEAESKATELPKIIDLSQLSDSEIELELRRRNEAKNNERAALKQLIAETVPVVGKSLMNVSSALTDSKSKVFEAFKDILTLKEVVYGLKSNQQSHTFSTDEYSITFGYRINDGWDDTTQVGVTMINNYLKSLAKDDNSALLVESLTKLLRPDKNGNLKASRVLEMQQIANKHQIPELLEGVQIIIDGRRSVPSNWFIDASVKSPDGTMQNIPLSISTVDFPSDFSFEFLNPKKLNNE